MKYSPHNYYVELERKGANALHEPLHSSLRFALVNHRRILNDISRGEGEFIDTYLRECGVDLNRRGLAVESLRRNVDQLASFKFPYEFHRRAEDLLKASETL